MSTYLPFDQRTADKQYRDRLKLILEHGTRVTSQTGTDTLSYIAIPPMRFRLSNGFPMITERNMAPKTSEKLKVTIWQQAIAELIAFINGARTQAELESFGVAWWAPWVTQEKCHRRGLETGDLGPGSYGAAFHDFPTAEGKPYNQFQNIVEQIKELPHLKTHFISPWIPQYTIRGTGKQQKVVVCPCHGWIHILIQENKLSLHMFQRSGDLPIGVPSNMVQYAALTLMLAQATGYEPYEYIHSISDTHIYVDQVDAVTKMLEREPRPFPTVQIINKKITNLFDFRYTDFELSEYDPHPGIAKIPVAI
jgi:thymidylate synthase